MHVFRPLLLVVGLVVIALAVRTFVVPSGFGIHDGGYDYEWYNQADQETWRSVKVKYQGREYCQGCHTGQVSQVSASQHAAIQCENCHGPAIDHPSNPPKLTIDRSRDFCLRCHADIPSALSGRAAIKGRDPLTHNPGIACVACHSPHSPKPGGAS